MMKIANFAIDPSTDPQVDRDGRALFRRKLVSAARFIAVACFLTAVSSSKAGAPAFITTPPAISPATTSLQTQGPLNPSANLNQTAMTGIMNELNQRQSQLSTAAGQTSTQFPIFVPERATIRRAK